MVGLVNEYKHKIDEQAKKIYDNTIIRKLPTYLKKIVEEYPSCQQQVMDRVIKCFPYKDKPSIIGMLIY